MKLTIERPFQEKTLRFNGSVAALLSLLAINAQNVLVVKNGALVTLDETVCNKDTIKLLSVISGG